MITLRSTSVGIKDFIKYLNECNYSFVLSTTTNSSIIVYADLYHKYKVIFAEGVYMSKKEMILQKKLKKEIEKNTKDKEITFSKEKKIHFF